jgi:hypothetical protein
VNDWQTQNSVAELEYVHKRKYNVIPAVRLRQPTIPRRNFDFSSEGMASRTKRFCLKKIQESRPLAVVISSRMRLSSRWDFSHRRRFSLENRLAAHPIRNFRYHAANGMVIA